jgi:ACS family hexuronate transporter-like MFS transporter
MAGYRQLRWIIVAMLFVSTVLNYADRQTLSVLAPTLRSELHLSDHEYSFAVSAFLFSYTIMYTLAGRLIDRVGVRIGLAACIGWWSIATMLTSIARGPWSLAGFRFLLGIGEPGVFPGGLKATAQWFPRRERALPAGIFSSGSAVGAVIAPPLIAWLSLHYGWRYAFVIPGALALLWMPLWLLIYRSPFDSPGVDAASRDMLRREELDTLSRPSRTWWQLLRQRRVWALVLPRMASDPVWYFYLFWLPDYLQRQRGLTLAELGFYGWIPYLAADAGNVAGGGLSDWLIRRGWSPVRARIAMLIGTACLAPIGALAGFVTSTVVAVAIISLIAALCQCWSTNTSTLALDVFPESEKASVTGLMGTAGGLGGIVFSTVLGFVISQGGYPWAFVLAAALHPLAACVLVGLFDPPVQQLREICKDELSSNPL